MGDLGSMSEELSPPALPEMVVKSSKAELLEDTAVTFRERVSAFLRCWLVREIWTLVKLAVPVVNSMSMNPLQARRLVTTCWHM